MPTLPIDLLRQAKRGEESAKGTLLESFRPYLELLARVEIGKRLQAKVDTADVVQETFLEAYRNFSHFRGDSEAEFAAWLRSILSARVSNLVRHYITTQGRDLRREQPLEINVDQSSVLLDRGLWSQQSSPSQSAQRRERGVILAEALDRLPRDYREVVILRHLEELTFPQVAERMERSVDSVQKLWVRALASLRRMMEEVS
ncbi:MAG: sigma-70 family RNA polymerase sigma factor [Planctomycetota bacterium]|nr:sigma-70 family RNA polymerase sigma factor [Planctomycetota bacterium]